MSDEASIKRQWQREKRFTPPYCPNKKCPFHIKRDTSVFRPHGYYRLKRFPYLSPRFICTKCDRTFSGSFFKLYFRQKVWGLNEEILEFHSLAVSKRATARRLNCSEKLVRIRKIKMARWGLLFQAKRMEEKKIKEAIVYDGLENFSFSQYDPNNINHAVGKGSLFIYDYNFAPLNRKGRISPRQKKILKQIEERFGRYPRDAIRRSSTRLFQRLTEKADGSLVLYTDKHYQYRRSIEVDLKDKKIHHIKVSSKIARNFKNPLFAVNNIDMQARHNLSAFKRETIAFSKHSIAMLESFALYALYRNFMRPKFWGTHRSDPLSCKKSPAMELKIVDKIMSFKDVFQERVCLSQVTLNEDWLKIYKREDPYTRRVIASSNSI